MRPVVARIKNPLPLAFCLALTLEFSLLTGIGWYHHWLAHPPKVESLDARFIEAQIFELPQTPALTADANPTVKRRKTETAISVKPNAGRAATTEESQAKTENETVSKSLELPPNHGPIAIYAPSPVIPEYLRDQEFKSIVVIDFMVSALGASSPRLVSSSGNEELDALALKTASLWQFRPAEKDHKPIDAKVRLNIVFQVH